MDAVLPSDLDDLVSVGEVGVDRGGARRCEYHRPRCPTDAANLGPRVILPRFVSSTGTRAAEARGRQLQRLGRQPSEIDELFSMFLPAIGRFSFEPYIEQLSRSDVKRIEDEVRNASRLGTGRAGPDVGDFNAGLH